MAFTYDPTLADNISQVRSLIQDTVEAVADFQDEEITYFLTLNNDEPLAAARECAFRLYVLYSKQADITEIDDVRIEYRNRAKLFSKLYEEFKKQAQAAKATTFVPMYFGGVNKDSYNANRNDQSLVPPTFTKDSTEIDWQYPENSELE